MSDAVDKRGARHTPRFELHILDTPAEMTAIEDLQRQVWLGSETEVVPSHMLMAIMHNGGLAIGAYLRDETLDQASEAAAGDEETASQASMIGFVFGFPGLYDTPDGPRSKHCSHMMGVLPAYRNSGVGFALKRAQWQMVRRQGIDRITWTFDPLLSRNAHLNIARLGTVCNTYLRDVYGSMRDGMNAGLPTDRFQVDWWVNSTRVARRLSKRPRPLLDLAHFLAAETPILNPTQIGPGDLPEPRLDAVAQARLDSVEPPALLLVEIPADFLPLKAADPHLAAAWRQHTRDIFEHLFRRGYLVTDFVHLAGSTPRSFYVLSYEDSTF